MNVPIRRRERGIVLLVVLAILVLVAGSILISRMNRLAQNQALVDARTTHALAAAKAALIGYAAIYPDNAIFDPSPKRGPGRLPCPDTDGDGSPNPPCGPGAIGWLPDRYLGVAGLRDGAGERLWYALSDDFRNSVVGTKLNSETAVGQLTVDSDTAVIAVVLAPGAPVEGQSRPAYTPYDTSHLLTTPVTSYVSDYLEGENADGDSVFTRGTPSDTFDDRLVAIKHDDLVPIIERRVLGEVRRVLNTYRTSYGAYPWLAPFANPEFSDFKADPTNLVREGFLPLHRAMDETFTSEFRVTWNVSNATIATTTYGSGLAHTVSANDLTQGGPVDATGTCKWEGVSVVDCTATATTNDTTDIAGIGTVPRARTYTFDIKFTANGGVTVTDPTSTDLRRRTLQLNSGTLEAPGTTAIAITDRSGIDINDPLTGSITIPAGDEIGSGTLTLDADTTATVTAANIRYYLAVPDEVPQWFVDNDWYKLVRVVEAAGYAPGGGGACTAGATCLTFENWHAPTDDKGAIAMVAGAPLSTQSRPSNILSDYFEQENAVAGDDLEYRNAIGTPPITATFNDQLRVIAP